VSVPVRGVALAATAKLTAPIPDPVAPAVTVIQLALLTAVHEQLVPEITESVKALAISGTETAVGVTVAVHCASTRRTPTTKTSAINTQQSRSFIDLPLRHPLAAPHPWNPQ
jgi:hypothetical protein